MRTLTIALCFALGATACSDPDDEPEWSVVLSESQLDRVLLAAWASGPDDIWTVGGDPGGAPGASFVLRYDGVSWSTVDTGATPTFWWVWGDTESDLRVFVGEDGAIARHDGMSVIVDDSGVDVDLFGAWGSSATDIWAVGGNPLADPPAGVILHRVGDTWVDETPAGGVPGALFKVWGTGPADIFAVGAGGIAMHYDGTNWIQDTCGSATLFTVDGAGPADVWAVGGAPATVCHFDGTAWSVEDTGIPASLLNGVDVTPAGEVWVVGMSGVKLRRDVDGTWHDETLAPPATDLHAVFADVPGHVFAVGGNFFAPAGATRIGVVAHFGTEPPAGTLVP